MSAPIPGDAGNPPAHQGGTTREGGTGREGSRVRRGKGRRGMRRSRRVFDDLTGRASARVIGLVQRQIDTVLDGVAVAGEVTTASIPSAAGRSRMNDIEHRGDDLRRDLVTELFATLITPIDREDLFRLSRAVDDVLDNLRDYVREIDLYAVLPYRPATEAFEHLAAGLIELRNGTGRVVSGREEVIRAALAARKRGGRVRQLYQLAMADLLAGPITADALKQRELLRRLDVVGLRLGECADALADAMLKRSM